MSIYDEWNTIHLPCGGTAHWDDDGIGYRCTTCMTYTGSAAQPAECVEARDKYEVLRRLGSRARWNYETGQEEMVE